MSDRGVLVTGASGRIGAACLNRLSASGWRTRALVHRAAAPDADEQVVGDVTERASLDRAVAGVAVVAHLAAVTHARAPERYFRVNAEGTANLVEAARAAGVARFVFVSTRAIDRTGGAYSASKAAAEEIVAGSDTPWTIVRLPEVYGLDSDEGVDRIVSAARRGDAILVVGRGDQEMRPICVDDAVAACVAAVANERTNGRTYTLAGDALSVREFARTTVDVLGSASRIIGIPRPLVATATTLARVLPLPVYPDQLSRLEAPKPEPSPEAADDLDFRPRSLREGLTACG